VGVLRVLAERLEKGNLKKTEQLIPENALGFSRAKSKQRNK